MFCGLDTWWPDERGLMPGDEPIPDTRIEAIITGLACTVTWMIVTKIE